LPEQVPVVVEDGEHVFEPGAAPAEGGDRADRAEVTAVGGADRQPLDHRGRLGRSGDDLGAAQPGEVEGLRGRPESDAAAARGRGDGEKGDVLGARQGERRVDLVGEDPGTVAGGGLGDPLQLLAGGHAAGRVVRAAEDQRPGSLREGAVDALDVELGPRQRHFDQRAAGLLDHREEGVVDGRVDDDAVARLRDLLQDRRQGADHVGAGGDGGGVDRPAVPPQGEFGEDAAQLGRIRIAAVVELDRLQQRPLDRRRQREVHLRNPGREHVGRVAAPLDAAALAQALQGELGQDGVEVGGHPAELCHSGDLKQKCHLHRVLSYANICSCSLP
jgi:hypothetical protein